METLFLLRHGETAWNNDRRVMGRLEVPLNRKGILQARRVARLMSRLAIDAIYSSPLKRALETSHIVADGDGVPIRIEPNLTEFAFGRWQGCQFEEIVRDKSYQRFLKDPLKSAVPGGETIVDVQKRGLKALRRATREFSKGRLLFVSHGDVIRALICHYSRLPLEEFRRLRIDNGSLSALEVDGPWAEIKFINYLPDIVPTSKTPYEGIKPARIKKR